MNKRNIHVLSSIILFFLILFALGCGKKDSSDNKTTASDGQQSIHKTSKDAAIQDGVLEIVDLAGRTVTIPTGDVKVILGESRMIYAIAPLFGKTGNAFMHIVGWKDDLENYDPDAYEMYLEKFPTIDSIANLGSPYKGDFSIEKAIALNADVVIMNLQNLVKAKETKMIEKLEKAKIQTVFVDFRQRPTQHTVPSILLLGELFQKQYQARKVINFYLKEMQKIYSSVAQMKEEEKPLVFMESAANAGWGAVSEYGTWGSNNMGRFVEIAGGKNYGTSLFGLGRGKISAEQLFVIDPDVIIGTGANWSKAKPATGAVLLGYKATKKDSQERLKKIASRKGWKTLKAVQNKRVHSIYHQFYNSPYNFVAIQQIAQWLYPDKFADLNPEETFKEFHDTFLPIDYSGMFWANL